MVITSGGGVWLSVCRFWLVFLKNRGNKRSQSQRLCGARVAVWWVAANASFFFVKFLIFGKKNDTKFLVFFDLWKNFVALIPPIDYPALETKIK